MEKPKQEIMTWDYPRCKMLDSFLTDLIVEGYTIDQVITTCFVDGPYVSNNPLKLTSATIIVSKNR